MVPKRKLTTDDLFRQQQEAQLDELQRKAQIRLAKSRRFKTRVKKLTGQRLTPSEAELMDEDEDEDEVEVEVEPVPEKVNGHHPSNGASHE
ncbi:MAG: hypothetical protein JSV86_05630 [Gemmatimonadota bacterium]|nr:MAG: hypothetical protein JSV86_05630 [Gemmatimonadota bacterium]